MVGQAPELVTAISTVRAFFGNSVALRAYPYTGSADLQAGCRLGLRPAHGLWRRGRRQYIRSGDRRYSNAQFTDKFLTL
jgi:hypothetical protein